MESGIKHANLRNCRKDCRYSLDSQDVCRIMKRSEYRAFLKLSHHLVCYELAADELLRTMNYAMSYSLDILKVSKDSELLVKESINDSLDSDCVVCYRHLLDELFLACRLMLDAAHFHSDPLDETFGEEIIYLIALHIKKLILE